MSNIPKTTKCGHCGMDIDRDRTYHPYAACLMYKSCYDAPTVEANLAAVIDWAVMKHVKESSDE